MSCSDRVRSVCSGLAVEARCRKSCLVLLRIGWSRRSRSDMSGLGEDWSDRVSRGAVS